MHCSVCSLMYHVICDSDCLQITDLFWPSSMMELMCYSVEQCGFGLIAVTKL